MNKIAFTTLLRRSMAIASLCVLVATATATWLSTTSAEAAPGTRAPVTRSAPDSEGRDEPDSARTEDDGESSRGKTLRGKLNLNTATEEQLVLLPGVGPAKAQRILEYRTKRGKFVRVKDLRRVKGFGYKTLKKLEPYLTVDGPNNLALE